MYFGVGNRCGINIPELGIDIPKSEIIKTLCKANFEVLNINISELARQHIGASYKRGASILEAPHKFDCSLFAKWIYGKLGVFLPRYSIEQRSEGIEIEFERRAEGDLIFSSGRQDYYWHDPNDGVGHVGIITDRGTAIHAASADKGVVESTINGFLKNNKFRGIRRIIPEQQNFITVECPPERIIERSTSFRWVILQNTTPHS